MQIRFKALPPEKALEFFRQKGFKIGFDHRDVWQAEHQAAFTVAKAMQMDLLRDIRAHVDSALEQGTTFQDFRGALMPNLVQRGWWGRKMMSDPVTGEVKEVQLGSTRRLKVIYDMNLRQAHSEGQWARIQEAKESLPFLMYDHTSSAHERKEHAAWDGLIFRVDDPWVLIHSPVKAWGCKCRWIQLGNSQLKSMGLKVSQAPPEKYVDYVNSRTGEKSRVPAGVDPAFNYPPGGRRAALVQNLADRISQVPADLRTAAIRSVTGDAFSSWAAKPVGAFPVAVLAAQYVAALGATTDIVRLSAETMLKQQKVHPEIDLSEYSFVQDAVDRGRAIQESEQTMVFLLEDEGYVSVVKATASGKALFLTSFRRLSSEDAKRQREIQRLMKKK
jgi:hypothetical protein